jgi:hypothetical protein
MSGDFAFSYRFREVDFFVNELMPEKMDIAWGVVESFSDNFRRQALNKGSPQSFVASLPFMYRA